MRAANRHKGLRNFSLPCERPLKPLQPSPRIGNSYRWTPRTQRSFLWPSQGSFACKETFRRKALSGIGKPPGVPIRLIHCCELKHKRSSRALEGAIAHPMSNRSVPNLEERLKHASEARKSMLAKFKMSLVEGPAAIEKRQRRQAIAAARAARAVQREEARLREEADRAKQAELAAHAQPTPSARRPSKPPETLPNKQNVMRYLRLNRRRSAMPVTRHGRPPRSNGGEATSPNSSHKRRSA